LTVARSWAAFITDITEKRHEQLNVKMGRSDFGLVCPIQSNHTYHEVKYRKGGKGGSPQGGDLC